MRVQTVLSISKLSSPPVLMLVIGRFERKWGGWMAGEEKREEKALSTRGNFVTGTRGKFVTWQESGIADHRLRMLYPIQRTIPATVGRGRMEIKIRLE